MTQKIRLALVLMLLVMVWPVLASAQEKPAQTMQFVVEKIRADKQLFVAENMKLTEAEAQLFWPVYARYQDELFLLRARTLGLISAYAEAYGKMDNDTAKQILDELIAIEAVGPKLRMAFLPEFQKALPNVKVVRYYQIENKINAALMYDLAAQIPLIQYNP
jgi:hypothetical protein